MKANVLVNTVNMDREEWLKWRKKGIGGSDAAAIAGLNPWRSPIEVYLDKIGKLPEQEDNEKMYWGRILEDIVAREFMKRTNKKVRRKNAMLQHPEHKFMLANIDRELVGENVGLECKTASEYAKDEWVNDKVPEHYILQCQHYMEVTGYQGWWIAALIGGNKFIYKYIERNEEIINYLIQIETEFWQMVENKTPPDVDGSKSSAEVLKILYPESKPDTETMLPLEAENLITAYGRAAEEEKKAKERKEEVVNKLKALLREHETGKIGDKLVSWKTIKSSRLNSRALKVKYPEIYYEFVKENSYRKFSISKLK
ncbi:YqaJ viral recombinase family protein [Clostridium sp.]|jgi:putative phage-type endonuclease|uniref:YqaJ viral recombinase family nuclease n=1 Tax=Clostridium sp. TaxID=1506 RepID=UPI003A489C98